MARTKQAISQEELEFFLNYFSRKAIEPLNWMSLIKSEDGESRPTQKQMNEASSQFTVLLEQFRNGAKPTEEFNAWLEKYINDDARAGARNAKNQADFKRRRKFKMNQITVSHEALRNLKMLSEFKKMTLDEVLCLVLKDYCDREEYPYTKFKK